jgi:hypothetical protein
LIHISPQPSIFDGWQSSNVSDTDSPFRSLSVFGTPAGQTSTSINFRIKHNEWDCDLPRWTWSFDSEAVSYTPHLVSGSCYRNDFGEEVPDDMIDPRIIRFKYHGPWRTPTLAPGCELDVEVKFSNSLPTTARFGVDSGCFSTCGGEVAFLKKTMPDSATSDPIAWPDSPPDFAAWPGPLELGPASGSRISIETVGSHLRTEDSGDASRPP